MANKKVWIVVAIIAIILLYNQNRQEIEQAAGSISKDAKFSIGNTMKKVDISKESTDYLSQSKKLRTNLFPFGVSWCCDSSCNWPCYDTYNFCYDWCNNGLCPGQPWCDAPPTNQCESGYVYVGEGLCCPEAQPIYTPPDHCCPTDLPLYCNNDNGCYAEHWRCTEWSPPCQGASTQTRVCTAVSPCAAESNKPPESRICDCTENWQCSGWSECIAGTQTKLCNDLNNCGTTITKPITSQSCTCVEDWSCSVWSSCSAGTQTRTCTDSHSCGTTTTKPTVSQSCACVSHSSFSCYDNDEYWYDSCGVRQEKKKECGSYSCSSGVCQDKYGTFLMSKNNYLNGGSFSIFITKANEWVGIPISVVASYISSSFSMNDGCSGTIKLAPDSTYNMEVCLNDGNSDIAGSCKTYTSGEYGAGDTLTTNPASLPSGQYRLKISWKRIKDTSGNYDHGGSADSGNIWPGCQGAGGPGDTCCPGGNCDRFHQNEGTSCKVRGSYSGPACIYKEADCSGNIYYTTSLSVWRQHTCRVYENYIRTGGTNAGGSCTIMNGFDSEGPGYGASCINLVVGYVVGCTLGVNPSCPSNLCTYAGDNIEYTSYFTIDSSSGTSSASFTQNKIISSGTISWS